VRLPGLCFARRSAVLLGQVLYGRIDFSFLLQTAPAALSASRRKM
jgi:hypothetical protein